MKFKFKKLTPKTARALGFDWSDEFPVHCSTYKGASVYFEIGTAFAWVLLIETKPDQCNKGHATKLLKTFLDYLSANKKKVDFGEFTDDGEKYLKPMLEKIGAI